LLVDWLSIEPWPPWYDMMVLMFQREVAERIVASENDEAYGRLAVLANWRAETKSCSTFRRRPSCRSPR
jgi:Dimethyladenosine transferase (rRNA methylation)